MLWFYGIVRYDDAFGSPHEYRFLYRYGGGSLRQHYIKRYSQNT